jgi:hypothetical protein
LERFDKKISVENIEEEDSRDMSGPTGIEDLPVELVCRIVSFTTQKSLFNLLFTSKKYYDIAKKYLYRHIEVGCAGSYQVLDTLLNEPTLVENVRALEVESSHDGYECRELCDRNLHDIIAIPPKLEKLRIYGTILHMMDINWTCGCDDLTCGCDDENPYLYVEFRCGSDDLVCRSKGKNPRRRNVLYPPRVPPPTHDFNYLKDLDVGKRLLPLHAYAPVFRLPSLEILKVRNSSIVSHLRPEQINHWKNLVSNIRCLKLICVHHRGVFKQPETTLPLEIQRMIDCSPKLESFAIHHLASPAFWARKLLHHLRKLPIRYLHLHRFTCNLAVSDIHDLLRASEIEELYLDSSLLRNAFPLDDLVLPRTLRVLHVCFRDVEINHDSLELDLQRTNFIRQMERLTGRTLESKFPHLRRFHIHSHAYRPGDMVRVSRIAAGYAAVGIEVLVKDYDRYLKSDHPNCSRSDRYK